MVCHLKPSVFSNERTLDRIPKRWTVWTAKARPTLPGNVTDAMRFVSRLTINGERESVLSAREPKADGAIALEIHGSLPCRGAACAHEANEKGRVKQDDDGELQSCG